MVDFQFSGGIVQKKDDFILRITFEVEDDISVNHLKEISEIRKKIFGENYYCSIIDVRKDFMGISHEAKEYVAKHPNINKFRVAEAMLVKNLGQKLGVSLYIRLFKPQRTTKIFLNEDDATKWLAIEFEKFSSKLSKV